MPISGHDTDEVMNMKKFLGGIKKNIFYISLITGMAVLVTVLGLYNAQTNSKEKTITIGPVSYTHLTLPTTSRV